MANNSVDRYGNVIDSNGRNIGTCDSSGAMRDSSGTYSGHATQDVSHLSSSSKFSSDSSESSDYSNNSGYDGGYESSSLDSILVPMFMMLIPGAIGGVILCGTVSLLIGRYIHNSVLAYMAIVYFFLVVYCINSDKKQS